MAYAPPPRHRDATRPPRRRRDFDADAGPDATSRHRTAGKTLRACCAVLSAGDRAPFCIFSHPKRLEAIGLGRAVRRRRVFEDWCCSRRYVADAARRLSSNAASWTASSLKAPRSGRRRGGGTGGASYVWQRGGDGGWSFAAASRAGSTGGGGGSASTGGLATSAGRAFSLPRLRLTYLRQALSVKGSQPPPAAARASATRLSFNAL